MFRSIKDESGATILLVAFLLIALLGLMAVAVDVPRVMLTRNQMQLASDAGALAAAVSVLRGDTLAARDSAFVYALANRADSTAMAEDSAFTWGVWNTTLSVFDSRVTPWGANSVRVRTAATGTSLVAWILGYASTTAQASAIAVFTSAVTETTCTKPLAVGLQTIDTNNDGEISEAERDAAVGKEFLIKPVTRIEDAPSFYYSLVLPPFYDATYGAYVILDDSVMGSSALRTNIEGCNPDLVGVGDSLLTKPGNNFGPLKVGYNNLCGYIDPVTDMCNPTGLYSEDGLPGIPIVALLWDTRFAPLGRTAVEITDLASFRITHVTAAKGKIEVRGFYIKMMGGGAAEPGVGLIERPILVR